MRRGAPALLLLPALLAGASLRAQEPYLLVLTGLGGEESYSESFHEWALQLIEGAARYGVPEENVVYLGEDPERDPERIRAKSSKENVEKAMQELAGRMEPQDELWIVLFGHGSFQNGVSKVNLPGRDMTDADFARLLDLFGEQTVTFVNTTSSSGAFLPALSGEGRVVVTATKSGFERNETHFGRYFSEAFTGAAADTNKDERISILEAYEYARARVARHYETENLLVTEHPQLDDNGDGKGTAEPGPPAEDGALAGRVFLGAGRALVEALGEGATVSAELQTLLDEKLEIEGRIESLRQQRDSLEEDLYLEELETLMLALATKNREIEALRDETEPGERAETPGDSELEPEPEPEPEPGSRQEIPDDEGGER